MIPSNVRRDISMDESRMTARKFAPLFENCKACLAFASRPSFIPNIVSSEVCSSRGRGRFYSHSGVTHRMTFFKRECSW